MSKNKFLTAVVGVCVVLGVALPVQASSLFETYFGKGIYNAGNGVWRTDAIMTQSTVFGLVGGSPIDVRTIGSPLLYVYLSQMKNELMNLVTTGNTGNDFGVELEDLSYDGELAFVTYNTKRKLGSEEFYRMGCTPLTLTKVDGSTPSEIADIRNLADYGLVIPSTFDTNTSMFWGPKSYYNSAPVVLNKGTNYACAMLAYNKGSDGESNPWVFTEMSQMGLFFAMSEGEDNTFGTKTWITNNTHGAPWKNGSCPTQDRTIEAVNSISAPAYGTRTFTNVTNCSVFTGVKPGYTSQNLDFVLPAGKYSTLQVLTFFNGYNNVADGQTNYNRYNGYCGKITTVTKIGTKEYVSEKDGAIVKGFGDSLDVNRELQMVKHDMGGLVLTQDTPVDVTVTASGYNCPKGMSGEVSLELEYQPLQ